MPELSSPRVRASTTSSARPRVRRKSTVKRVSEEPVLEHVGKESHTVRPDRSMLLWTIVGGVTVLILVAWGLFFRWTMRDALIPKPETSTSVHVRKEFERGLGEFQKNFTAVAELLNARFANEPAKPEGDTALSPDELRALQERVNAVNAAPTDGPASIDFTLSTWEEFSSAAARIRLRHPKGWTESVRIGGERIAAFVRPTTAGLAFGDGELFVDVRANPENDTLREFYKASGRVNLYQAATGGTSTVFVDGIRAVQFNAVSGVTSSTIASVRHRNRVIEFSVLGTDAEHMQLLQKVLSTVHLE